MKRKRDREESHEEEKEVENIKEKSQKNIVRWIKYKRRKSGIGKEVKKIYDKRVRK